MNKSSWEWASNMVSIVGSSVVAGSSVVVGASVVVGEAVGGGPCVPGVVGAREAGKVVNAPGSAVGASGLGAEVLEEARPSGPAVGIPAGFMVGPDEAQTWIIFVSRASCWLGVGQTSKNTPGMSFELMPHLAYAIMVPARSL